MGIIGTAQLLEAECDIDDQYARSGTRTYEVFATIDVDEVYIRNNLGIYIFNTHPSDVRMVVKKTSVKLKAPNQGVYDNAQNTGGAGTLPAPNTPCYVWLATVTYGPWNPIEHTDTGEPTDQPLRVRMVPVNTPQIVYEDVDGNPIVNSAGDYYDPPIERDYPRWTLTIVRNETSPSPATIGVYANRTNESDWNGFPAKTVKLSPMTIPEAKFSQFSGAAYWEMEYTFEINFDTWTKVVLNQGYRQLAADGTLEPILVAGTPASTPVMLDENGHAILTPGYEDSGGDVAPDDPGGDGGGDDSDGTGTGTGTDGTVVMNAYEIYRPLDFSVLDSGFTGSQQLSSVLPL